MTIEFEVKFDSRQVERTLRDVERKAVPAATRAALNKVVATVKSRATKQIVADTGITPQREVRNRLIVHKANRMRMFAKIVAKRFTPNLIRFKAKQPKGGKGVTANVYGQKGKLHEGAFIANQGRTVFKRVSDARLPIEPVFGPSLQAAFLEKRVNDVMVKTANERLPIEFERALQNEIRKVQRRHSRP